MHSLIDRSNQVSTAPGISDIHQVARKHPELALCAAVIHRAITDARTGDVDAVMWLASDGCRWYLSYIAPEGVDPYMIQELLMMECEQ